MAHIGSGTFVKICGISRVEDALASARAGADAVGFVFAQGPRKVSLEQADLLGQNIHPPVRKIGVFVDASHETIETAVRAAGLDGVQLHGSESPEMARRLRALFPELFIVKAMKVTGRDSLASPSDLMSEVDAVMFDRKDVAHPDRKVQPLPFEWLDGLPLDRVIIAGGLTPENVGDVVGVLRPWGVDASGGLEGVPGVKDPARISAFVQAVRKAEAAEVRRFGA